LFYCIAAVRRLLSEFWEG